MNRKYVGSSVYKSNRCFYLRFTENNMIGETTVPTWFIISEIVFEHSNSSAFCAPTVSNMTCTMKKGLDT